MARVSSKKGDNVLTQVNLVEADYVSQTDVNEQTIARLDHLKFQPISVPSATEGRLYYDTTAKKLKLRDDTEWLTIPGAGGGGGSAAKGDYSYLIYRVGSDYYAEDWEGNLVYGGPEDAGGVDGADCQAVVQAAVDNLPLAWGGSNRSGGLFFKNGYYDFDSRVLIDGDSPKLQNGVNIIGEDMLHTRFHPAGNFPVFVLKNTIVNTSFFNVAFYITSDEQAGYTRYAIDSVDTDDTEYGAQWVNVEQCFFNRVNAIRLRNGGASMFYRNWFERIKNGINLYAPSTQAIGFIFIDHNLFMVIDDNVTCVSLAGHASPYRYVIDTKVENNICIGVSASTGNVFCKLDGCQEIRVQNNRITNVVKGIEEIAAMNTKNEFFDNKFRYVTTPYTLGAGSGSKIRGYPDSGYVTVNNVLSPTFPIDAVSLETVTIPHGCSYTPAKQHCQLTVVEDSDVDDWGYDLLKVDSVDGTNVTAKINVSNASATGDATAKLGLRVNRT